MTSIEFLQEKLTYVFVNDKGFNSLFEQAKEMHKQEIMDAYEKGEFDCGCNGTGEDYYDNTFKKD